MVLPLCCVAGCSGDSLPLATGEQLPLSEIEGKTLVVNVWAEWCGPCREEVPEMNALMQAPDITVVGIDFDRHPTDKLSAVLAHMGIQFPQLAPDAEARWALPMPTGLPVTYLIKDGRQVLYTLNGPQTRGGIQALLANGPAHK